MGKLYIIKAGTTFPETAKKYGDFEDWTLKGLGLDPGHVSIVHAQQGEHLPLVHECSGVIVTGSHDMVSDELAWSERIADWIPELIDAQVPFLGICYGHQLLAKAIGGQVGYHPGGEEIGTVSIDLLPDCATDPLFQKLPSRFQAQVTHEQTVLSLPANAIRLAANAFEDCHAFRIGECAWGVQFHPEYDADIMRSYIEADAAELKALGQNVTELCNHVRETPEAASLLLRFSEIVQLSR